EWIDTAAGWATIHPRRPARARPLLSSLLAEPVMDLGLDYHLAADARASERTAFIRRTYGHLAGAILAFALLETVLFTFAEALVKDIVGLMVGARFSWLVVLGAFMLVSWVAERWAMSGSSPGMQYLGLGLYVVAQAVLFLPLLYVAQVLSPPGSHIVAQAG